MLRPNGLLVIAELYRAADMAQGRSFIDLTALPRPIKPVYAMATIRPFVRAGLSGDDLSALAGDLPLSGVEVGTLPGLAEAFLIARRD